MLPPEATYSGSRVATDDAMNALATAEAEASVLDAGVPEDDAAIARAVGSARRVAETLGSVSAWKRLRVAANTLASSASPTRRAIAARALVTLGDFATAARVLTSARVDDAEIGAIEAEIALGEGDLDRALERVRAASGDAPERSLLLGRILGARGDFDGADSALQRAERSFAGRDPFLLADVYTARALLHEGAGDLVAATPIYRAALDRVPLHAHAATHLASLVPPAAAIALLEPLAKAGAGPDVLGALAVYRELLHDHGGDADRTRAAEAYAELLAPTDAPLAPIVANHAGWFYLRVASDAARARQAADVDVRFHPSSEAFELALGAYDAPADRDARCAIAARASAFPFPSIALTETLRRVGDCRR